MSYLHHCEVSDSFVHPDMKLLGGRGNGESRLFISCSESICKTIEKHKKVKIKYTEGYINHSETFVNDDINFKNKINERVNRWKDNINNIEGQTITIELQNGGKDISRNYIAQSPHRNKTKRGGRELTNEEKINIKKWDMFRKSLVPTKTRLEFHLFDGMLLIYVSYNNGMHKYNIMSGCSFISIEFFKSFSLANNIEIQHAMNGVEHKERKENGYFWPVDGYHNCEKHKCCGTKGNPCFWNNYVFEFQGTYWHRDRKDKDLEKKNFYVEKGYKWFEISEFEYNTRRKLIKEITKVRQNS